MAFPAEVADKLFDAAARAGVRRERLLADAGIEEQEGLSYAGLAALYEAAARLTADQAFGLHVGERTRPADYGLLGYAAAHSTTLGEALERLVALQEVWTEAVAFELECDGETARLRYLPRDAVPAPERRQECEQMMAAVLTFTRTATGRDIRPIEVAFEHEAPRDATEHRRIFGCQILFGAPETETVLAEASLALAIAGADPQLGALISAQAETALAARQRSEPLIQAAQGAVRAAIESGRAPALADAAAALGVGPRTLQRRLLEQDHSWRQLVDEVRIALAQELLAEPRTGLAQIAFRTGFSQASAFHRAFRRIAGTTPRRYRLDLEARRQRR